VRILLECESRALVTESLADDFWWNTGIERDGGVGVPEVVKPNSRQVHLPDESVECLR